MRSTSPHVLLSKSDFERYFTHTAISSTWAANVNELVSDENALRAFVERCHSLQEKLREKERHYLESCPSLVPILSAIDKRAQPHRSKSVWEGQGYDAHPTEWFLDKRDFRLEEQEVLLEIHRLRLKYTSIESHMSYLRGKAIIAGVKVPSPGVGDVTSVATNRQDDRATGSEGVGVPAKKSALTWEGIELAIVALDTVRIRAGEKPERKHFASLGFADKRKGDQANCLWELLLGLAGSGGHLSSSRNALPQNIQKNLAKWIQKLNDHLQRTFNLTDKPIYHESGTYHCRFRISNEVERPNPERTKSNEIQDLFDDQQSPRFMRHQALPDGTDFPPDENS